MRDRIVCRHLGKEYRIGSQEPYQALRDVISEALFSPAKQLRKIFAGGNGVHSRKNFIWAIRDIDFSVNSGEIVGLIGRNGAGKTTLLKVLSRITEPTEGTAELHGQVGSLLEVGTGFHPELSGRENIFFNGAVLGMKRREIERKFDEIVAFAEVEKYIDTPVKRYSSGMYLRLAFSVAAHLETEILFVDEVLAVGDQHFQRKCLDKMHSIGSEGRTVLFVSHNMAAVTRLCTRAILLENGRIVEDGPSHHVVSRYLQSGSKTTAEREWTDLATAPGDEMVRLLAVRIRNRIGEISDAIDIRDPFAIEIQYHNTANNRFPYAGVQLFDENGVLLFTSGDFANLDWRREPRDFTGTVTSRCQIPGNLLAEGQIRVLVSLTGHNPDQIFVLERDAVSFLIVDRSEGDGARGEYASHFPGVVRPLLEWEVSRG